MTFKISKIETIDKKTFTSIVYGKKIVDLPRRDSKRFEDVSPELFSSVLGYWSNFVNKETLQGLEKMNSVYQFYYGQQSENDLSLEEQVERDTILYSLKSFAGFTLNSLYPLILEDDDTKITQKIESYIRFRANRLIKGLLEDNVRFNSTSIISNIKSMYTENTNKWIYRELYLPLEITLDGEDFDSFLSMDRRFKTS